MNSNSPNPNIAASPPADTRDDFVTKKELATKLKVTLRTIENWQRAGYLPYLKISSVVLFHYPEIVAHLNANFKVCRRGVVRPRSLARIAQ